jgi:hypothetical protein
MVSSAGQQKVMSVSRHCVGRNADLKDTAVIKASAACTRRLFSSSFAFHANDRLSGGHWFNKSVIIVHKIPYIFYYCTIMSYICTE